MPCDGKGISLRLSLLSSCHPHLLFRDDPREEKESLQFLSVSTVSRVTYGPHRKNFLTTTMGAEKDCATLAGRTRRSVRGAGKEEGLGNTCFSIAQLGGKLGTRSLIGHHHHASITTGSAHEANTECLFRSLVHHAADASKPPMATCLLSQRFWCVTGFRHTPRCCIHFAFIRPRGKK